jgi:group II intron reverse transcriptase/maturase
VTTAPRRWGTEAQGTHRREGEAGHNEQLKGKMGDTPGSQTVSTKLQRIAEQAQSYPETAFTTLGHLIDVDFLREAHKHTRKDAAPGIDGVTAKQYAENLEENLRELHQRIREQRYRAQPVKRVWLEKEDGSKRPIGIPAYEDKIVQRAVTMLLEAVYEQDFHDFSHGYRRGHSPHQALDELRRQCMEMNINWIVDVDVCGFFDNLDREKLREIMRQRVNDGGIIRLIGKWLNAGVIDGEDLNYPERGTPQGSVISPILANVFLHHVLDDWFVREVKPRMKGRVFLIRYADDAVIGCELEEDARRIMTVLPKRFGRFGLTVHPKKTKLVRFEKPKGDGPGNGGETFDFLGFTHYWARSRRGYWVIKRRTAKTRVSRTMKAFWRWCRENRHMPVPKQHSKLSRWLRGHYQYYAIRGNYQALERTYEQVRRAWRYWLSRRSHKGKITWERYEELWKTIPLPRPRIIHAI